MNRILFTFGSLLLVSCATSKPDQRSIENAVRSSETRTLSETRAHVALLLEAHPELNSATRASIKLALDQALEKHQLLRDQESKIVYLLLTRSVTPNPESLPGLDHKLEQIYQIKHRNILALVSQIIDLTDKKEVDGSFTNDLHIFLRDFR